MRPPLLARGPSCGSLVNGVVMQFAFPAHAGIERLGRFVVPVERAGIEQVTPLAREGQATLAVPEVYRFDEALAAYHEGMAVAECVTDRGQRVPLDMAALSALAYFALARVVLRDAEEAQCRGVGVRQREAHHRQEQHAEAEAQASLASAASEPSAAQPAGESSAALASRRRHRSS